MKKITVKKSLLTRSLGGCYYTLIFLVREELPPEEVKSDSTHSRTHRLVTIPEHRWDGAGAAELTKHQCFIYMR